MNLKEREQKIKSTIEEITGIKLNHEDFNKENKKNNKLDIFKKNLKIKEFAKAQTLEDFENIILSLEKNIILKYAKTNKFSNWLNAFGEIELADKILLFEKEFDEGEKLRKKIIDILEDHRYSINKSYVTSFQRKDVLHHIKLSHIGTGAYGGKARGIAFLAKILSK